MVSQAKPARKGWSNGAIAAACLSFFAGMVGMSYASVPLYRLFCQVTGFGGTTQRAAEMPAAVGTEIVTIRFNADAMRQLGWIGAPCAS